MARTNYPPTARHILIAAFMALLAGSAHVKAQAEKDPHRPTCTDAYCRKIKSFLKTNYCGESPFGNGPDDGCELRFPKNLGAGVGVKADFKCEWNTGKNAAECEQRGQISSAVRGILIAQLTQLGLAANADGRTYFAVWESSQSGWSVAEAYYSRSVGSDIELSQVIVLIAKARTYLCSANCPSRRLMWMCPG